MGLPIAVIIEIVGGVVCVVAFLSIFISPFLHERDWEEEMRQRPERVVSPQLEQIYSVGGSSPRDRASDMYGELLVRTDGAGASNAHPISPHYRGRTMV